MVADRAGATTPYALFHLQPRGVLFIGPGTDVYEGMIVGEHNRPNDLDVNVHAREEAHEHPRRRPRREHHPDARRASSRIDTALEFIDRDELVEVTPDAVRLRKKVLDCNRRPRRDEE